MLERLRKELRKMAEPKRAEVSKRFFKTGKGEYREGDVFVGLSVSLRRKFAKKYRDLQLTDVLRLLHSKIHEERNIALFILVDKFEERDKKKKREIYSIYLRNTKWINNWDLVDSSADRIIGAYLINKSKGILFNLARSKNLWERRISMIATYAFIKNNKFEETLKIAEILLQDKHDLIHKAVGWMLREIGKRDLKTEIKFLNKHSKQMPRTMLRYAIERFPQKLRLNFLKK